MYGDKIEVFKQAQKNGLKTPLGTQPKSCMISNWYIKHFYILSKSRGSSGFGPNPLNILDIIGYLNFSTPILEEEISLNILQDLDQMYLEHHNEESRSKDKPQKTQPKLPRPR